MRAVCCVMLVVATARAQQPLPDPVFDQPLLVLKHLCTVSLDSPVPRPPRIRDIGSFDIDERGRIDELIERLAISQQPATSQPVYTPDEDAPPTDKRVIAYEAAKELRVYGKAAFPHLLEHLDDDRQSVAFKRVLPASVGEACFAIIEDQVFLLPEDYPGSFYRKGADGEQHERPLFLSPHLFDRSTVRVWLEGQEGRSLAEMQIEALKWMIAREKHIGFSDEDDRVKYLYPLERQLEHLKARSNENSKEGLYWGRERVSGADGPEIRAAYVFSQNNSNSSFRIEIITEQRHGWPSSPIVVAGNRTYDRWGTGKIVNPPADQFFAENVGRLDAEAIAKVLKVPCALRRDPGHGLTCQFTPVSPSYGPADDVLIRFTLKNTGKVPIQFEKGGDYRGTGRQNRFRFDITLNGVPQQDVGSSNHKGGFVESVVLKPGESDVEEIDLRKWCAFDVPGEYAVRGAFDLELRIPRDMTAWPDNLKWAHEQWDDEAVAISKIRIKE